MLELRLTKLSEVDRVMEIITQSQQYFKEHHIDQWQNNYPNHDVITRDIENKHSFVLLKDQQIVATVAISFDKEPTYNEIVEGQWKSNENYAVIHRIAVDTIFKGAGLASHIFSEIELMCQEKQIKSIKIDTHKDNMMMQNLLKKIGFEHCGIIYLADRSSRVAFEKII